MYSRVVVFAQFRPFPQLCPCTCEFAYARQFYGVLGRGVFQASLLGVRTLVSNIHGLRVLYFRVLGVALCYSGVAGLVFTILCDNDHFMDLLVFL